MVEWEEWDQTRADPPTKQGSCSAFVDIAGDLAQWFRTFLASEREIGWGQRLGEVEHA